MHHSLVFLIISALCLSNFHFLGAEPSLTCDSTATEKCEELSRKDLYPTRIGSKPPEVLERVDPVVFQKCHETPYLTLKNCQKFEEDGYILLENVFSQDEIKGMLAEVDAMAKNSSLELDTLIMESGSNATIRKIFRIFEQSELFHRIGSDPRMIEIAKFLMADNVYVHQSRINFKSAWTGKQFFWHSDFETWHAEDGMRRPRAISAVIFLTDNVAENGPLMVIPGSHKQFVSCSGDTPEGFYKETVVGRKPGAPGLPSEEILTDMAGKHGLKVLTGKAGNLLYFDANLLHASNANLSPFPRHLGYFIYNSITNKIGPPFAAKELRKQFLANRDEKPEIL